MSRELFPDRDINPYKQDQVVQRDKQELGSTNNEGENMTADNVKNWVKLIKFKQGRWYVLHARVVSLFFFAHSE